ncbi:MAG: DNA adenine methylase [Deltaproteobacteria bacterium]|nr:DNA adenine methylase [Deltaproteobacteria bacterium]
MPDHVHYVEPYFGSGAVLFKKERSKIETVNDLNGDVINLFRVLRERPQELTDLIYMTPWSREEYCASYEMTGDELEDARRFLVRCWQAFGTRLNTSSGWKNEGCGAQGKIVVHVWRDLPERILAVAERLRGVQIENSLAVDVINRLAAKHTLIYADPPYLEVPPLYAMRTSEEEHCEMLDALKASPGPVLLSGYENDLYSCELVSWEECRVSANADGGRVREEVLWLNPVAVEMREGMLF